MLKIDGFDDCIIGLCEQPGGEDVIAYDLQKIINKIMVKLEVLRKEAQQYFDFGIAAKYDNTGMSPVFIDTRFDMKAIEELTGE